jgi:hypothetical protein
MECVLKRYAMLTDAKLWRAGMQPAEACSDQRGAARFLSESNGRGKGRRNRAAVATHRRNFHFIAAMNYSEYGSLRCWRRKHCHAASSPYAIHPGIGARLSMIDHRNGIALHIRHRHGIAHRHARALGHSDGRKYWRCAAQKKRERQYGRYEPSRVKEREHGPNVLCRVMPVKKGGKRPLWSDFSVKNSLLYLSCLWRHINGPAEPRLSAFYGSRKRGGGPTSATRH